MAASLLYVYLFDEFADDAMCGGSRRLRLAPHHHVGGRRGVVIDLDAGGPGRASFPPPPAGPLGVPRDANGKGAVDEDFQEPGDFPPGPVPVGAPVGGGVEDHGYAVFGQEPAHVGGCGVKTFRSASDSRTATFSPSDASSFRRAVATVDFPDAGSPVIQTANPASTTILPRSTRSRGPGRRPSRPGPPR